MRTIINSRRWVFFEKEKPKQEVKTMVVVFVNLSKKDLRKVEVFDEKVFINPKNIHLGLSFLKIILKNKIYYSLEKILLILKEESQEIKDFKESIPQVTIETQLPSN